MLPAPAVAFKGAFFAVDADSLSNPFGYMFGRLRAIARATVIALGEAGRWTGAADAATQRATFCGVRAGHGLILYPALVSTAREQ